MELLQQESPEDGPQRETERNRFLLKFATGHFACGRQMKCRKEWVHDRCPVCGAPDENNRHVLVCQAVSSRATWTKSLKDLEKWMIEVETLPAIRQHILALLQSWVDETPQPAIPFCSMETNKALQVQNTIGAFNMILSRVITHLEECQNKHYKARKLRRSGRRWTVELIKKLQDVAWDMWDHRNSVLHNDPTRHHRKTELDEANAEIEREWTRGAQGLLAKDQFLFRSKEAIEERTLEKKREWLACVQGARDAASMASSATQRTYSQERNGIGNFLNGLDLRGRPLSTGERPKKKRRKETKNKKKKTRKRRSK